MMLRNVYLLLMFAVFVITRGDAQEPSDLSKPQAENWAEVFLAEDPLSAQEHVTIEDIRRSLSDPKQRDTVLTRHISRLDASTEAKKAFLAELLTDETPIVRRQAATLLGQLGWLEEVIVQMLLDYLESDDTNLREAAIVALTQMDWGEIKPPDQYWKELIDALNSEETVVQESAKSQLARSGFQSVPLLIDTLSDPRSRVRQAAAWLLSEIVGSNIHRGAERITQPKVAAVPEPIPESMMDVVPTTPKNAIFQRDAHLARRFGTKKPDYVQVFYGTNRAPIPNNLPPWRNLLIFPFICLATAIVLLYFWNQPSDRKQFASCSTVLFVGLLCIALIVSFMNFRDQLLERSKIGTGAKFGPRRDPDSKVHYGSCNVSIPPTHSVGELESPLMGTEEEEKHVILRNTNELEEKVFFDLVRSEVAKRASSNRSCFVFIHGFNVNFENAARRTAQIHHDLKFAGVPIFFSWPSRASVNHYFSDRNEIEYSRYIIKQFLLDVADRVEAERIHIIAHSMGADATCRAIADMGERGKIFDQIILAAPDIDRDVFRTQLLPRMAKTGNRTTMYCSRGDLALHISYTFNDAPRAGDSSRGILVTPEMDTVDASGIDTALLGHSYYGDCGPILNDVRQLVDQDLGPEQRQLKPWPFARELKYWTFPTPEDSTDNKPPNTKLPDVELKDAITAPDIP